MLIHWLFLAFLFFSTVLVKAQDQGQQQSKQLQTQDSPKAQIASELSQDLSGKLNLSDEQTKQLKNILVSYQDDVQGAVQSGKTDLSTEKTTTNTAIDDLLNPTQKSNWEKDKAEFWSMVDSKVTTVSSKQESKGTY